MGLDLRIPIKYIDTKNEELHGLVLGIIPKDAILPLEEYQEIIAKYNGREGRFWFKVGKGVPREAARLRHTFEETRYVAFYPTRGDIRVHTDSTLGTNGLTIMEFD